MREHYTRWQQEITRLGSMPPSPNHLAALIAEGNRLLHLDLPTDTTLDAAWRRRTLEALPKDIDMLTALRDIVAAPRWNDFAYKIYHTAFTIAVSDPAFRVACSDAPAYLLEYFATLWAARGGFTTRAKRLRAELNRRAKAAQPKPRKAKAV